MTDKNLYILKQPVEVDYKERVVSLTWPGSGIEEILSAENFDKDFVRLDVESLTTQLDRIFDELGDYRDVEGYFRAKDRAVAEVLSLLGMKGNKNETCSNEQAPSRIAL